MQICIVSTQLCYILMQKEWHFNFKNEMLKHADNLPQNGGNRVSEDLKFQNFPGEDAPGPPYREAPLFKPPMLKTWIRARYSIRS